MASNGQNNTQTFSSNTTPSSATAKRRASRKNPASAARTTGARKAPGPVEILFKELPNPYVQPQPPYIWIDYPQQNERLFAPMYVMRLGVGGAEAVEISIDKGPWQPCRLTSGYWWYDWAAIPTGKHQLVARMRTTDGRWFKTPPRSCDYRA